MQKAKEEFAFNDVSDNKTLQRLRMLDASATTLGNGYLTCGNTSFSLGDYIASNLRDHPTLSQFAPHSLCILWIACCPQSDNLSFINTSLTNVLLEPISLDLLPVLCEFVEELNHTLLHEFPIQDRIDQLADFTSIIQAYPCTNINNHIIKGAEILTTFQNKARGLSYLPNVMYALPFFLQVHPNCDILVSSHSYLSRICRNPHHVLSCRTFPNIRDWIQVIKYMNSTASYTTAFSGNTHPEVLIHFTSIFRDQSVLISTRCLQLFTIYHPEWEHIWTLIGWKSNRFEHAAVLEFKHDFPAPFYQDGFLNSFFHIFNPIE